MKLSELLPKDHVAFAVEDVDGTCETLMKQGLVIEIPPRGYYWGRSAYLRDPDGCLVELTREKRSEMNHKSPAARSPLGLAESRFVLF